MNICGHIIKTDLIIGIGPIYVLEHPDPRMRNIHRPVALGFEVHTTERSIEVKSEYFKVGIEAEPLDKGEAQDREAYKQFEEQYYNAQKEIADLLNRTKTRKKKNPNNQNNK